MIAAGGPALAASCPAGGCVTNGSVNVTATITETIDNTAFSLGGGAPVAAGQTAGPNYISTGAYIGTGPSPVGYTADTKPDYTIGVATGDSAGYSIMGSATQFSRSGAAPFAFSALNVQSWNANAGKTPGDGSSPDPTLTATPVQVNFSPSATSGTDMWGFAASLTVPLSAGNGLYTSALTYSAIAQ